MAEARLTQAVLEVLEREIPVARLTQASVEVLRPTPAEPDAGAVQPAVIVVAG